jgi:hypothetical protein
LRTNLPVHRKRHPVGAGQGQGVGQRPIVFEGLRRAEIEVDGDAAGAGREQVLQNLRMVAARPRPGPAAQRMQARRIDHDQHQIT